MIARTLVLMALGITGCVHSACLRGDLTFAKRACLSRRFADYADVEIRNTGTTPLTLRTYQAKSKGRDLGQLAPGERQVVVFESLEWTLEIGNVGPAPGRIEYRLYLRGDEIGPGVRTH